MTVRGASNSVGLWKKLRLLKESWFFALSSGQIYRTPSCTTPSDPTCKLTFFRSTPRGSPCKHPCGQHDSLQCRFLL